MNKTTVIAIIAIAVLAGIALLKGVNGTLLAGAFTIIGGLGGFAIGKKAANK